MSEYKQIKTRIWQDNWFLSLTPEEKLLWIFLITNEHSHLSGLYELPMATIEPLVGVKDWKEILTKFVQDGKIRYQDGWVYILNKKKHQPVSDKMKDNVNISIKRYLSENKEILAKFDSSLEGSLKGLEGPSDTLRQIEVKVKQQQQQELEQELELEVSPSQINEVLDIVYKRTGGKEVFGNPFTRGDATKLIKAFGYEEVLKMAEFAMAIQGKDEYCPVINTIGDLLSKWPKLVYARDKANNKENEEEDANLKRFYSAHPEAKK